jgi:predicted metal-dependent phosphoesterase TrpH
MSEMKRADLHIHTHFSKDGASSPEEVVDAAVSKGVHVICITDHDTIEGALKAQKYAQEKYPGQIDVLVGQEISVKEAVLSDIGHIIAIGIKEPIAKNLPIFDAALRIHKQNGLVMAPHVYSPNGIGVKAFSNEVDCIEAYEADDSNVIGEHNARKMAERFDVPKIAASGAHRAQDVGKASIAFKGDLFRAILLNEFLAQGDKVFRLPHIQLRKMLDI